jgi:uncharacterized membrane protein YtjA (UPF0391 family)
MHYLEKTCCLARVKSGGSTETPECGAVDGTSAGRIKQYWRAIWLSVEPCTGPEFSGVSNTRTEKGTWGTSGIQRRGQKPLTIGEAEQAACAIQATVWLGKYRLEVMMLRWALGFFVIALIAAVLGFGGIAVAAAGIAKIIFYIFLALFIVSLIGHLASRT